MKSIENFTSKNTYSLQKQHYDSINNFYIDLDNVMFTLDSLYNQTYTFKINRNPSNNLFENLILKSSKTGDFDAILAQYNQNALNISSTIPQEIQNSINENVTFTYLGKKALSEISSKFSYNEQCFEPSYVYTSGHSCASGEHSFADGTSCTYWGTTGMATTGGYVYTMVAVTCNDTGGSGGSDFSTGPHSGGGGTSDLALPPNPCDKIKKAFAKPALQAELSTLSGQTSELTERGRFKVTTANIIQTPSSNANGEIIFNPYNNSALYTMMAHTHNSPANTTYSVFSWTDLENLAKLVRNGSVDTANFVSFLATADGTYYAFTIEDPIAFSQFFATRFDPDFDLQIATKKSEQMKKYYFPGNGNNPLIKENNTDYIEDEKAFLDLMNDNNLGATLFESNSTFTTFDSVKHNTTTDNIDKQPCN